MVHDIYGTSEAKIDLFFKHQYHETSVQMTYLKNCATDKVRTQNYT